jgi:hypothetical protein
MAWSTQKSIQVVQNLWETNSLVLLSSGSLCDVNPLIFRASRYVLWGEIENLAFKDKKIFFQEMTSVLQRAVMKSFSKWVIWRNYPSNSNIPNINFLRFSPGIVHQWWIWLSDCRLRTHRWRIWMNTWKSSRLSQTMSSLPWLIW